jgi:hypothetical protein
MNTSTDTPIDPLVKDLITLCHDNAVGGAVNSDDEEDTMEISEAASVKDVSDEPDTPPACGADGNSSCVCGECDYKHYVALVAKHPEVTGHFFTTHPCNLPLGNIAFKPEPKNTKTAGQANSFFKVVYESLTDYRINFVLEWPDFEVQTFSNPTTGKDSYVCKLHLKAMMEEGEDSLYQRHEAKTLHHTLQRLEEKYLAYLDDTFKAQNFTIEPTHFQAKNGCMYLPLDTSRRAGGGTIDKMISQYNELQDSGLLIRFELPLRGCTQRRRTPPTLCSELELNTTLLLLANLFPLISSLGMLRFLIRILGPLLPLLFLFHVNEVSVVGKRWYKLLFLLLPPGSQRRRHAQLAPRFRTLSWKRDVEPR